MANLQYNLLSPPPPPATSVTTDILNQSKTKTFPNSFHDNLDCVSLCFVWSANPIISSLHILSVLFLQRLLFIGQCSSPLLDNLLSSVLAMCLVYFLLCSLITFLISLGKIWYLLKEYDISWKNSHFIILAITIHSLPMRMLISFTVNEILLPRYVKLAYCNHSITIVWFQYMRFNKIFGEKAWWNLHKDAASCFEKILD